MVAGGSGETRRCSPGAAYPVERTPATDSTNMSAPGIAPLGRGAKMVGALAGLYLPMPSTRSPESRMTTRHVGRVQVVRLAASITEW